ncbi:MAG: hypothetical protein ACYDG4_04200 [Desulfuromonadaceae bacterium]
MSVAVLFARSDSVYKSIPGCDVYDFDRDALSFTGGKSVIAHPPCRSWGRLSHMAKPRPGERDLAFFAVDSVRKFGGVLEHPKGSRLWSECNLPLRSHTDSFGGFTIGINQSWFGHRAEKSTLLYICGLSRSSLPPVPFNLAYSLLPRGVESMCTAEREKTPLLFAEWLVDLAGRCGGAL